MPFSVPSPFPLEMRLQFQQSGVVARKQSLKLSSSPAGADIALDGNFVGQTPSSVLTLPGDHYIKIVKTGYKPWERTITTSGGEVTVVAELDTQQ